MKHIKIAFLALIFTAFLFNCSDNKNDTIPAARTYAEVEAEFSAINFVTGINDIEIENTQNALWRFRVIMPDVDFTNNDRPLILTLHGAAGGSLDAHKNTACYAEPGFEALDAIIVSPNGASLLWNSDYNQLMIFSLIDLITTHLPVDGTKIVVNGYSNGGNGSWFFAETQPLLFSAGIPMASSYNTINNGVGRLIDVPLYVIHGEDDELFPLADTQAWVQASVDVGSDITLEVAPGLTHNEPCSYVSYLQNAATWLENDVW